MKSTQRLQNLGQSIWLDNITRELLTSGTLKHYIDTYSVTGLTSNPSIFDQAIKSSSSYDDDIRKKLTAGKSPEELFFELAIDDITAAADLFTPIFERTSGVDGWVSLEVSPMLAYDTSTTISVAKELHARAGRDNLFIKIPGTKEGLPAIEAAIFAGVPVNVTLLFSHDQFASAADAYLRGIERRIAAGLSANVASVASVFISRWDVAVHDAVPAHLRNTLGIAVGQLSYQTYLDVLASTRFQHVMNAGARPQRLLFASTGTKDPKASNVLYVEALAAPLTVNTIPEATLNAFAAHGKVADALRPDDSGAVIAAHEAAGIDVHALAERLQDEGAKSFVKSWKNLLGVIESKGIALHKET